MQFIITAHDGENMLEKRMAVRPRHLESMAKLGKHIVLAGGLLDGERKMKGSVLILDLEDRAALDDYLKNEPYVAEHVWEKIEIEPVNVVIVNGKKVVSWCANECGYIDAGVMPKTASCLTGSDWFKERGQWQDNSYEPRPGDIIYFDWDNKGSSGPQNGVPDHVGIVERV